MRGWVAVFVCALDDHAHGQVHGERKVQVALVVGGHGHDGAVAVVRQYIVRCPDRQSLTVHRVDGEPLQEHASLGPVGGEPVDVRGALDVLHIGGKGVLDGLLCSRSEFRCEVGVRRDHHERGAVQGIGARGVDGDGLVAALNLERDIGSARASNPVALHRDDFVGPGAAQVLEFVE